MCSRSVKCGGFRLRAKISFLIISPACTASGFHPHALFRGAGSVVPRLDLQQRTGYFTLEDRARSLERLEALFVVIVRALPELLDEH